MSVLPPTVFEKHKKNLFVNFISQYFVSWVSEVMLDSCRLLWFVGVTFCAVHEGQRLACGEKQSQGHDGAMTLAVTGRSSLRLLYMCTKWIKTRLFQVKG